MTGKMGSRKKEDISKRNGKEIRGVIGEGK